MSTEPAAPICHEQSVSIGTVRRDVTDWIVPIAIAVFLTFGRAPMLGFAEVYTLPERVLNVLLLVVAPAAAMARIAAGRRRPRAGLRAPVTLLVLWVGQTVLWSPTRYWPSHTSLISIVLAIMLGVSIHRPELSRVRRTVLVLSGIFSCYALIFARSTLAAISAGEIVEQLGLDLSASNVIILPRILYVLVFTCLISVIVERKVWMRIYASVALLVPLIIALSTAGRGPLVGFVAALLVLAYQMKRRILLVSFAIGAIAAMGYKFVLNYLPGLLAHRAGAVDSGRFDIWQDLIATGRISLFGQGLQSDYPHNIFLEFLYNYGIIGLTLFLVFLGTAIRILLRDRRRDASDPESLWLMCLFVLQLTAQQFSLDIFYSGLWAPLVLPYGSGWKRCSKARERAEVTHGCSKDHKRRIPHDIVSGQS